MIHKEAHDFNAAQPDLHATEFLTNKIIENGKCKTSKTRKARNQNLPRPRTSSQERKKEEKKETDATKQTGMNANTHKENAMYENKAIFQYTAISPGTVSLPREREREKNN